MGSLEEEQPVCEGFKPFKIQEEPVSDEQVMFFVLSFKEKVHLYKHMRMHAR
jgi:hypothetical protein